ncbi:MAG: GNAT family N-acetyltransferase [Flavobacteriaceae bacterium]|nr:GNAT family N-acetyltransferase [Flavobacteriaceae bacterium]
MEDLKLKPAEKSDITAIAKLASDIWQQHYVPIIGQEQVAYMLENIYNSDSLQKQIEDGHHFSLVMVGGEAEGFVSVSNTETDTYFLHKFYINQNQQGMGVGRRVFEILLETYPSMQQIVLTVNRQNFKSINFYFKLGFKIIEVKDFDIGNGYFMNDFIMAWQR